MKLAGKVILVTGGAVRIGRAIALACARRGAMVGITYNSSEKAAAELVAQIRAGGGQAAGIRCNQRDPAQIAAACAAIREELGVVAALVNNAAIFRRTPMESTTPEDWDEHLEVNLRGPALFCKELAPAMRARGDSAIINLVDIAAERPYPAFLPYSASKAGLINLTQGLARVLAPQVRVNAIAIGTVLWPENYPDDIRSRTVAQTPLARVGNPEDVAAAVLYLIEEAQFTTGAVLNLDGGRSLV